MVKLPGEPLTPVADAITGATGSEAQYPVFEVTMRVYPGIYSLPITCTIFLENIETLRLPLTMLYTKIDGI